MPKRNLEKRGLYMKLNELDQWLNAIEKNSEDIPADLKSEVIACVMDKIHSDFPITDDEFDGLLDTLKDDTTALSEYSESEISNRVQEKLQQNHNIAEDIFIPEVDEIDVDNVLENFNPVWNNPKRRSTCRFIHTRKKVKVAVIILFCIAGLSVSGVTYAAISGRLSGVFKATPELTGQLDQPNPVQQAVDSVSPELVKDPGRFDNSKIISTSSFDDDIFYNSAADVALENIGEDIYTSYEFIFDQSDIAVFTKENGESWYLNANENLEITIAIDTSFAASEAKGEDIYFAYVKDGKFHLLDFEKITDEPYTFTFTAPEDGCYYLAIVNASFSYLKVTTLEIN